MTIAKQIKKDLAVFLKKLRIPVARLSLEHPTEETHGDYATNIALVVFGRFQKTANPTEILTPLDLANQIVNAWRSAGLPDYLGKIEVVAPGFINLWLSQEYLETGLAEVTRQKNRFGKGSSLRNKQILLEHTSPNPQTTIMLGHLRNNFLGMAVVNLLEFSGAKVKKDCIVNDRGVHLCRAIWGYLVFGRRKSGLKKAQLLEFRKISDSRLKEIIAKIDWRQLLKDWEKKKSAWYQPVDLKLKPDHTNLRWYVLGSRAYKLEEFVQKQVEEILIAWEKEDEVVRNIWKRILEWSEKGYADTYRRVGSVHDWVWHESDHYQKGKEIVNLGLKKGVFRHSEGAIVTDLEKYGLPDTVVVKTDGTALYLTQDLALTKLKIKKFPSDLYIWDIGAEQTLYFKQLFAVCEQLGIGKAEKLFHLSYALINFKGGGKMATRQGNVVMADEILDELKGRAMAVIKASNQELRGKLSRRQIEALAETIGVGAVKYSLLKFARDTTIYFDIDESLALEGNSGPYLQYVYARTQSVLKKAKRLGTSKLGPSAELDARRYSLNPEELSILRTIYRFPEVIQSAAQNYAPNLICNYLFDLAQKYNFFYNRHRILVPVSSSAYNKWLVEFRLELTAATGQIIKNGLTLLGIETPEKM